MLSSHHAITRVGVTALLFTFVFAFNQHTTAQAGPESALSIPQSLLPDTVGVGVQTSEAVDLTFHEPMNTESVEAALALSPAQAATFSWNADRTTLSITPERLWRADAGYLVTVGDSATTASGAALSAPRRFAFSTQTAPRVSDFQVRLAEIDLPEVERADADRILAMDTGASGARVLSPTETARDVSASSAVRIGFSAPMNRAAVEEAFSIAPEVAGDLSWVNGDLMFTPTERLEAGGRYTISLVGARDTVGNELGDKVNFSFVVRAGPQLTRTTPTLSASGVEPATVEMWFSQPMNVDATNAAFSLIDTTTGRPVPGRLNWNETATQIVYAPDARLAGGRTFTVVLGDGAADAAGRPIVAKWSFTTLPREPEPAPQDRTAAERNAASAAAAAPAPAVPAIDYSAYAASGLEGYGLAQINGARAAYGFPPLVLDPTLSAMASAHAWDQIYGGYYAHAARPGGYSAWGENQCHHYANSAQGTIDWCHSVFMSEPWPGHPNHIGNILSTRYTRVGIGIADSGSRVVITWDFAN